MDHPFRGQGTLLFLLVPFLSGFFAGVAAGRAWVGAAALLLILSVPLLVFRFSPIAIASALMALCGVLCAGRLPAADPEAVRPFLDREVVLRARVDEARPADGGWSGFARDAAVGGMDGSSAVRLPRVRFFVRNRDGSVPVPSEIRATGRLSAIRSLGNPGELPRELDAWARGVQYAFSSDASRAVLLPVADGGVPAYFSRLRARTREWLLRHAGDSDGALYLLSLTTGDLPPASHPMAVLLRKTGLAHLLAISGVNVAVFFVVHAFLIRCALWAFRRRQGSPDLNRAAALLSLPVCWGYVLLAGGPLPALRSAGMITVGVFLWHALGVRGAGAAWSLLLFVAVVSDPPRIFSASFLLSYGATFFLIVSGGGPGEARPGAFARAARFARDALSASAVAFLGTLPMSAAFFGAVPTLAVAWNLLFGPILGAGGVAGAFVAAAGGVFSLDILGVPVSLAARGLTVALRFLERLSGSGWGCVSVPPAGFVAPAAATLCAAFGAVALRRGGRPAWIAVLAAAAGFLAWLHLPYAALPGDRLEVVALNVGRGAAHVVFFPGGKHMVVDCGSAVRADAGERVVAPFLRARGIRRIDVLVLTHAHEDHFGGAAALADAFEIGEIWIPAGVPAERFGPAAAARPAIVRPRGAGDRYCAGGAEAIVRAPGAGGGWDGGPNGGANERCLVVEIRDAGLSVWLPGDVEEGPSAWGPAPTDETRARVLFLPHHGSAGADPAGWLRAARPFAAISQNSNCYEYENLLPSNRYFRLENGAVVVCAERGGATVRQAGWPRTLRFFRRLATTSSPEDACRSTDHGRDDVEAARPDP